MTSTGPHQALYRRWRAQTFAQIVGQEAVVETLRNAVRTDRVAHAILFVGPRGTGKTSLARILAKALNCTDLQDGDPCDRCPSCVAIRDGATLDVLEIDAASNRGINEIKELRERLPYAPVQLRRKVYILDEAHQITRDAWNALLKSLEEPPPFVVFMFASTHPQEFPPAILSRLQRFDVRRLTVDEIAGKLQHILDSDGRRADPAAVRLIARLAAGGMRDAESMLDQLLATSGDSLDEGHVRDLLGLADAEAVDAFLRALDDGDAATGIGVLDRLEERGRDLRVFLDQLVEEVRARLVEQLSPPGSGPRAGSAPDARRLATVARQLAEIDPNRGAAGGLRLQLELTLFAEPPRADGGDALAVPGSPLEASATLPTAAPSIVSVPAPNAPAADAPVAPRPPGPPRGRGDGGGVEAAPPGGSAQAEPPRKGGESPEARETGGGDREDGGELAMLQQRWAEVVARISQHPPTKPLITACRPISVEGNVVTLGFPEDQGFLRDVAERRRAVLESGIAEFLGRPVGVRCVATNLDVGPLPEADPASDFVLAEARRIFGEDLADVGEVS